MTKLGLKLNQKSQEDENPAEPPLETFDVEINMEKDDQTQQNAQLEQMEADRGHMSIEEILISVGLDDGSDKEFGTPPPTMDWEFIRHACMAQILLSLMSLGWIMMIVVVEADRMRWYKFTASVWTLYLLITAYVGYTAGQTQCYARTVAYCIMNAFQTLFHYGSMAWLTYMIYHLDDKSNLLPGGHASNKSEDKILFLKLGETLALLGTIVTGICGLVACCKGFGRLLKAQDERIMKDLEASYSFTTNKELTDASTSNSTQEELGCEEEKHEKKTQTETDGAEEKL